MPNNPKILVFISYYLPGYKAGGPLRTISNMIDHLGHDFDFWIVTRDRDQGDLQEYEDVPVDQWVTVGKAQVFYCSPKQQTISMLAKVINETPHNILYLNSFFDPVFTLKPLLARFLGRLQDKHVMLAPRGEFSLGALKLKWLKKKTYIAVVQLIGWYKNITWHASSKHEANDIQRLLSIPDEDILIALDLPNKVNEKPSIVKQSEINTVTQSVQVFHIIFLSRISPMKNLDFALHILMQVSCSVVFHIYGPLEDVCYWKKCQSLIKALPRNVKAQYCGVAMPEDVGRIFADYDLFLFPTHGENYGHVIAEALAAGTPVLLSDQTPWQNLEEDGLGWNVSLNNMERFSDIIEICALRNEDEKDEVRFHVQNKAVERLTDPSVIESNKQLFYKAL